MRGVSMRCTLCNKNEATIHIQEISGGEKKILHICSDCAAKKSADNPSLELGGFKLAEMLYNLTEKLKKSNSQISSQGDSTNNNPVLTCPACGWDTQGLRNTGRLGCGRCYETFWDIIESALGNMHQGKNHIGKKPGDETDTVTSQIMLKILGLQKELEDCIAREEYEEAAKIRDAIAKMKRKIKKNNSRINATNE